MLIKLDKILSSIPLKQRVNMRDENKRINDCRVRGWDMCNIYFILFIKETWKSTQFNPIKRSVKQWYIFKKNSICLNPQYFNCFRILLTLKNFNLMQMKPKQK